MTFDMRDAREIAEKCNSKDESIDHDYWNAHAGMFLPTALDEIDRLQKEIMAYQEMTSPGLVVSQREAIDRQAKQIATLKSICIRERNRYLVDFIHEYDDVLDCKEESKKQLAREYPQIAWEEKK